MVFRIVLFIALSCLISTSALAAQLRTLIVNLSYSPVGDHQRTLTGYRLYRDGQKVCETSDPTASQMTCQFMTEDGIYNFTLTALFSDGTESIPSPPYKFTIGTGTSTGQGSSIISYTWNAQKSDNIAGYRMYMNDTVLCETHDVNISTLSCTADLLNIPMAFSVVSIDSNNVESVKSNFLRLDPADFPGIVAGSDQPLAAAITASSSTGNVPLTIAFNGENSTGAIDQYIWDFGDGSTASGASATHTYYSIGTYTAELTVVTSTGVTSKSTVTIHASDSSSQATAPMADISISTVPGESPLTVSFDGSSSTTPNPPMVSYDWNFGDGSIGTGSTTTHVYAQGGMYTATLRVTDSSGLSASFTIPVSIVDSATNQVPVATLTANPNQGPPTLSVTFDGSQSQSKVSGLMQYRWNFGDGATANGITVQHSYTKAGIYKATLQVIDGSGASSALAYQTITCDTTLSPPNLLTVTKTGTGAGTVAPDLGVLSWNAENGTATYNYNALVTLTAMPGANSIFIGWEGESCQGSASCSVTMDKARTVKANFSLKSASRFKIILPALLNLLMHKK